MDKSLHSAWLTSAVFGAANLLLLRARIRREERALAEEHGVQESLEGRRGASRSG